MNFLDSIGSAFGLGGGGTPSLPGPTHCTNDSTRTNYSNCKRTKKRENHNPKIHGKGLTKGDQAWSQIKPVLIVGAVVVGGYIILT